MVLTQSVPLFFVLIQMKLLLPLISLFVIVAIACGDSYSDSTGIFWDNYRGQIDEWQVQVDGMLAEADALLEAGPMENDEWLSSLNAFGIGIDSVTFAVSTVHPPSELQEFHKSFVIASDFYALTGRLLAEFVGSSEAERADLQLRLANEIVFGIANMQTAQVIYDEAAEKIDR